jgi:DNA-binding response OmpR family regulator
MVTKLVLIIDDDIDFCEQMTEALTLEGHSVEFTNDAKKGEKLIRDGNHDIILMDFKMPLFSGVDILKKLKDDNVKKRIFILSGMPFAEQTIKGKKIFDMVSGIIVKPINFKTLIDKINES